MNLKDDLFSMFCCCCCCSRSPFLLLLYRAKAQSSNLGIIEKFEKSNFALYYAVFYALSHDVFSFSKCNLFLKLIKLYFFCFSAFAFVFLPLLSFFCPASLARAAAARASLFSFCLAGLREKRCKKLAFAVKISKIFTS